MLQTYFKELNNCSLLRVAGLGLGTNNQQFIGKCVILVGKTKKVSIHVTPTKHSLVLSLYCIMVIKQYPSHFKLRMLTY